MEKEKKKIKLDINTTFEYNPCATETTELKNLRSPLSKLSEKICIPSSKKLGYRTTLNVNFNNLKNRIKQSSKKFLSMSENANDSKITSEQVDSENDSDYDEECNTEKEKEKEKTIESILNQNCNNASNEKNQLFEEYYHKFYMPSSENISGQYDLYVTNCLKLITILDPLEDFSKQIKELKENVAKQLSNLDGKKPLLIIDLDETLIHSDLECKFSGHDEYLETEGGVIPLNVRPNIYEFLDYCHEHFDMIIFTASCNDYADPIINFLEKDKKYFKARFYREHCIIYRSFFLKDISIFNYPLEKILIIDNCLFSFAHYLTNGVLVTSYYNDDEDIDLLSLIEFFKSCISSSDVRVEVENTFEFTKIFNNLKNIHI